MTIQDILAATTRTYRKGPEVTTERHGPVEVTHLWAMPPAGAMPGDQIAVDVHFMIVGVLAGEAEAHRADLVKWLDHYPETERLAGGPSYIELGGYLDSQDAALRLIALGKVLGLWEVVTPATMGVTGADADTMAGMGLVMLTGYRKTEEPHGA